MKMYNGTLILKGLAAVLFFLVCDFIAAGLLEQGMTDYYGLEKKAPLVCIGHSHTVLGIDADRMEKELGVPVAKYAIAGTNVLDRFSMIKHSLNLNPATKVVVYDVEARLFDAEGLSSASYTLFLPFVENHIMSEYLQQQATWQEYYTSRLIRTARYRDQTLNIAVRGLIHKNESKKMSVVNVRNKQHYLEQEKKRKIRIEQKSVNCFQETLAYLSSHGITVFLVNIPVIDLLNEIDPEDQEKVISIFRAATVKHHDVHFLNYNPEYAHRHELFFDLSHLNEQGKQIITGRLAADIRKTLGQVRVGATAPLNE